MSKVYLLQYGPGKGGTGVTARVRAIANGRRLRAPHYTVSELGGLSELALAAGGVLYFGELLEWRIATVRSIIRTWLYMDPVVRPDLVFGLVIRPADLESKTLATWLQKIADGLPPIDEHEVEV
jgi:hypothetical protein